MNLEFSDLYFIYNFKFSDSSTKNKYLLVLSTPDYENKIILSLPTSIGRVPNHLEKGQFGCINCDESHFNCFRFLKNIKVTNNPSFEFPLDTYIYGEWLQEWNHKSLKMDYSVEGVDYDFLGKLNDTYLKELLECFLNSTKVKRKYKKVFASMLNTI